MPSKELRTELRGGRSIADVATERSVPPAEVVDALVADAEERLAAAVAEGRLTQAEADERRTHLRTRLTALVERPGGKRSAKQTVQRQRDEGPATGSTAPRPGAVEPAKRRLTDSGSRRFGSSSTTRMRASGRAIGVPPARAVLAMPSSVALAAAPGLDARCEDAVSR